MNKSEFVSFMSDHHGCSKADAERAVNMVSESVVSALGKGDSVALVGFGTFEVKHRAAREGRNPQTGASMHIAASKYPSFKAGKGFKDACN